MTDAVSYQVSNGVAWLTIERPEARNALNAAVRAGLYSGVRRFNEDDSAKVLVLTGAGDKAFCAGGDQNSARRPVTTDRRRAACSRSTRCTASSGIRRSR